MSDLPAHILAHVDQFAAEMRSEKPVTVSVSEVTALVADVLNGMAEGLDWVAGERPGLTFTVVEVADLFRNSSKAFTAAAEQMPGGAS